VHWGGSRGAQQLREAQETLQLVQQRVFSSEDTAAESTLVAKSRVRDFTLRPGC